MALKQKIVSTEKNYKYVLVEVLLFILGAILLWDVADIHVGSLGTIILGNRYHVYIFGDTQSAWFMQIMVGTILILFSVFRTFSAQMEKGPLVEWK